MNIIGYAAFLTTRREDDNLITNIVKSEALTREAAEADFRARYGDDADINVIIPLVDVEIVEA